MFVLMVCLVLAAVSAEAEVVLGLPALYNNYHGEYAASYDNYEPRPYAFEYGVSDPHTGDHKTQWETKDKAGVVHGSYSLLEPDGTTRIVDYIADDHGFRAVVKKIGIHGQSIESHGGAAEQSGLVQPIVVPEIEPASIHLEQPAQIVSQSVSLEPQLRVQEQIPLHQQQIQQAPLFQSYDGGVEHYQTLVQHQLPYNLPVPKAEGIYVETPKNDFGYLQSYEPLPYLKGVNYGQQIPEAPRQEIRFQQQAAPVAPISSGGLYYTQQTEIGNPQGKSIITFQQPQQLVVAQEKPIAAANLQENIIYQNQLENQYLQQNQKLIEPYQNQRYALQNERLIEPHQSQLPVQSYQLQLNYPGENQILQSYGESSQNQGVQGITGNLEDDSAYTNYDQSNNAQLVLNQGEKFASTKYGAW